MNNPFSLEGKTILVTGASSGIGRQCAIDCSRAGAKVIAIARNKERLDETLSQLDGEGHNSYTYDFTDPNGITELVSTIVSECGKLSGMVYAAGIEKTMPFKMLKPDTYTEIFNVNTLSALELAKQVTSIKNFDGLTGGGHFVYFLHHSNYSQTRNCGLQCLERGVGECCQSVSRRTRQA